MTRALPLLLLLFAPTLKADEKAPAYRGPTFAKGVWTDAHWGLRYEAPGLRKTMNLGEIAVLFSGKAAGGVRVKLRVLESATVRDAAAIAKTWHDALARKSKVTAWTVAGDQAFCQITTLAGFARHQGYRFAVRKHQCFVVDAQVDKKTDTSAVALKAALDGLTVATSGTATMLAHVIARNSGRMVNDAHVQLEAGGAYLSNAQGRTPIPPLAVQALRAARAQKEPGLFDARQTWRLFEWGGGALLQERNLKEAAQWLLRAEKAARKLPPEHAAARGRASAYNLACAYSLAKQVDEGFAALYRAYEGGKPVSDSHVSGDRDLENLRRDERWHKFWREKVKGS